MFLLINCRHSLTSQKHTVTVYNTDLQCNVMEESGTSKIQFKLPELKSYIRAKAIGSLSSQALSVIKRRGDAPQ